MLELQNTLIDEFYAVQKLQSIKIEAASFEALQW